MNLYRLLADAIVVIHLAYVAFVVLGMAAILIGLALKQSWARNFWLRAIHFLMIAVVALESLVGVLCPLTEWEDRLRELAGETAESGSFIGRWTHAILFIDVSPTALTIGYCIFAAVVLLTLIFAPPRWPRKKGPRL